ncbi:hypothetical protein D3C72_1912110 [compost metagenome]
MAFRSGQAVGHVEAVPTVAEPGFGPGMAGQMAFILGIQIAGDVTGRNPQAAGTGQKRMGMVLTDARPTGKCLSGSGVHRG